MITEVAYLTIDPSNAEKFEGAVAEAASAFRRADGCRAMSLERVIENKGRYRLVVKWDSIDHHMITFRNSPEFQIWRNIAGPFFVEPPTVEHSEIVSTYF